jgi:lipid-A-disaccharide synthase
MAVNVKSLEAGASRSEPRRRRVMIVAGEASGDLHGAELAREIFARDPDCEIFGIAGERMRAAGVSAIYRADEIAGMGLTELAGTIRRTLGALSKLRAILKREKPDLLILIDFPDFNMQLAKSAKRAGVPVLYYIAPQVWAWRRGRIPKLIARTDRIAVVLPFEAELYRGAGERVTFVGHPLLDGIAPRPREETLARYGFAPDARLLAILPGSRRKEIRYLLEPMITAARTLARDHGLIPCLALAQTLTVADLEREGRIDLGGIRIIDNDTYSIVAASEAVLVASGTATLETALIGRPMVIAYKVSRLTWIAARLLVRGVNFAGMPNVLAGREIVPELIQGQVSAANLVRAAERVMNEPQRAKIIAALSELRAQLGTPGAAARVAQIALEMMG